MTDIVFARCIFAMLYLSVFSGQKADEFGRQDGSSKARQCFMEKNGDLGRNFIQEEFGQNFINILVLKETNNNVAKVLPWMYPKICPKLC